MAGVVHGLELSREKRLFVWTMIFLGFWPLFYFLQLVFIDPQVKHLLSIFKITSIDVVLVLWVVLALRIVYGRMPRVLLFGVLLFAGLDLAVLYTNEWHGLFRTAIRTTLYQGEVALLDPSLGWWGLHIHLWGHFLGSLGVAGVYLHGALRSPAPFRPQFFLVFLTIIGLILLSLPFLLRIPPYDLIHPAPVFFPILVTVLLLAILRYGFLDIAPMARKNLFLHLNQPVLIVDAHGLVVEANHFARNLLKLPAVQRDQRLDQLLDALGGEKNGMVTFQEDNGQARQYYLQRQDIRVVSDRVVGCLIIFMDITALDNEHRKALLDQKKQFLMDVHDGMGGILSTIYRLSDPAMIRHAGLEPKELLQRIQTLAQNGCFEVRTMLQLIDTDTASWNDFLADMPRMGTDLLAPDCSFELKCEGSIPDAPLSYRMFVNLHRLLKEAVVNIRKHSHASSAGINIQFGTDEVSIDIWDNGMMQQDNPASPSSLGLRSLRRRCATLGGRLDMNFGNDGSRILFQFPLKQ